MEIGNHYQFKGISWRDKEGTLFICEGKNKDHYIFKRLKFPQSAVRDADSSFFTPSHYMVMFGNEDKYLEEVII
jgi:hypothetical protein